MALRRRGGALEVVVTVEAAAAKWLRAEEEIQRMGRLNNSTSLYVAVSYSRCSMPSRRTRRRR